ncbi:52 kDa repressor of the inhibitor of the protein kinase [Biomphalaria pfeifferi]|uniref:52 kDa repressor of the inhibitor of the protein kinase n=1 Tax=Biomphalaria pfeifferi TaxID=112525 RepID=A0AAD8FCH6_BIOPF|nr:52 kDa repressor of the inhibitor of the protein kinase [Biomphalaria pfeifferi]
MPNQHQETTGDILNILQADETTDTANMEYHFASDMLTVDSEDVKQHNVKEMFLELIPTINFTGTDLYSLFLNAVKTNGLEYCQMTRLQLNCIYQWLDKVTTELHLSVVGQGYN